MPETVKWPLVRVEWHDPARDAETVTLEEAVRRFGLGEREREWLRSGAVRGVGVSNRDHTHPESAKVSMLHRWTEDDNIREVARELLEACEACVNWLRSCDPPGLPDHAVVAQARRAIGKARNPLVTLTVRA